MTKQGAAQRELITFRIDEQEFCVDIMSVREIRGWTRATSLPQSPDYIKGVVNLRGAVLPVIDLRRRLGLGSVEPTARHVVIVTHIGARIVGLLVDAVSDILSVTDEDIQPTPDVGCDMVRTFVRGLLAMDGRMISLISLDRMLPDEVAEAA